MDIKEIKRIIELMKENDLTEFEMADQGFRITVKRRNGSELQTVVTPLAAAPMMMPAPVAAPVHAAATVAAAAVAAAEAAAAVPSNLIEIKSPMVGTFYRSASPEAEAFAVIGKVVDEETVVCIIEAMKVMNEIKAEVKGTIRKVLVENATPVEYGQALFLVEPA